MNEKHMWDICGVRIVPRMNVRAERNIKKNRKPTYTYIIMITSYIYRIGILEFLELNLKNALHQSDIVCLLKFEYAENITRQWFEN